MEPERRRQAINLSEVKRIDIPEKASDPKDRISRADLPGRRVEMQCPSTPVWQGIIGDDNSLTGIKKLSRTKAVHPHQLAGIDIKTAGNAKWELASLQPIYRW